MPYSLKLAERVREYLKNIQGIAVTEKKMFSGLAFLVNNKMCVNISDDNLMCRFDHALTSELAAKKGFLPMIMKGKQLRGYCYVEPDGYKSKKDFEFWMQLCLEFNKSISA